MPCGCNEPPSAENKKQNRYPGTGYRGNGSWQAPGVPGSKEFSETRGTILLVPIVSGRKSQADAYVGVHVYKSPRSVITTCPENVIRPSF
eukprot:1758269-Rhodomonas_salina.1